MSLSILEISEVALAARARSSDPVTVGLAPVSGSITRRSRGRGTEPSHQEQRFKSKAGHGNPAEPSVRKGWVGGGSHEGRQAEEYEEARHAVGGEVGVE